jgi:crotonobetainyl-CoA:carnitine CoA-transferase CaiB-like acyl-CoA transferase
MSELSRPLEGLKVLDLSRLLPGPYLTLLLADLGADVIKIESPHGGDWVRYLTPKHAGMSVQFIALNRGKRSCVLDLKAESGRDNFRQLVKSADVVVESFRPGVMKRLGLEYEALRKLNPRLVYCAVTGYGQDGAYATKAGHDLNYQSLSGAAALTGEVDGPPVMTGYQLADIGGGALFGAVGVLAGLYGVQTTGRGRFVDVSMTEGGMAFSPLTMARTLQDSANAVSRGQDQLGGSAACYRIYETLDARYMSVAPLEPKFWAEFCRGVDRPDWLSKHMGHDVEMQRELRELFCQKTQAEWVQAFAGVDACVEPVLELDELQDHPLHASRKMFFELIQSGQPIVQMRSPLTRPEQTSEIGPAPMLGEHTDEVLAEAEP